MHKTHQNNKQKFTNDLVILYHYPKRYTWKTQQTHLDSSLSCLACPKS